MKDFPLFPTAHGAASLTLKEIPYRKEAFVHIQSSQEPELLLRECADFCVACGADAVYATGHDYLECFPVYAALLEMRGQIPLRQEEIPAMFPVTEASADRWRQIYNSRMRQVDLASTLERKDEPLLSSGGAYYIHKEGALLGIGWMEQTRIRAIASMQPGAGAQILRAMQSLRPQEQLVLEVASTNRKAIALYEAMGFLKTKELSRWYRIR